MAFLYDWGTLPGPDAGGAVPNRPAELTDRESKGAAWSVVVIEAIGLEAGISGALDGLDVALA